MRLKFKNGVVYAVEAYSTTCIVPSPAVEYGEDKVVIKQLRIHEDEGTSKIRRREPICFSASSYAVPPAS